MKKISSLLFLGLMALGFQSCDNIPNLTEKAAVGGMVWTSTPAAKYLSGQDVKLSYTVAKGPAVSSITLKAKFYSVKQQAWSNEVVLADKKAVSGNDANDVKVDFTFKFADLAKDVKVKGVQITEGSLAIADKWVVTTYSNLADGRTVANNSGNQVAIAVANFFAGSYKVTGKFTHPVNGPRDINKVKALDPVDGKTCMTLIGDLTAANDFWMNIVIDATTNDASVQLVKGPASLSLTPGKRSYYDPAKKMIYMYYQYPGSGGNRVIEEVYTFDK